MTMRLPLLICCSIPLLFLTMAKGGNTRSALILGEDTREAIVWANEILSPLDIQWTESTELVDPSQWSDYPVVIVVGKLPSCLEESAHAEVEDYLQKGGILICVGTGLHSLIFPAGVAFPTKFPDYAMEWIGAERCFYPELGWPEYDPMAQVWPWTAGIPFQPQAYGTHAYGLMGLKRAENVLGYSDRALIAVNQVGNGAFLFIGQPAFRLKEREVYTQAMRDALTTLPTIPAAERK